MTTKKLLSVFISVILALSCLFTLISCVEIPEEEDGFYTVTFDIGSGAREAGLSNPESQRIEEGEKAVQPTVDAWEGHTFKGWTRNGTLWNFSMNRVWQDITLVAEWEVTVDNSIAAKYEENLTWGEENHLYIHYLRGAHAVAEQGTVNEATAPNYSQQIKSNVYGDWGLWVWEYVPVNGEGRAFYPMKIDESGAVYDIDLTATYNDAGWNAEIRDNKGLSVNYAKATQMGIQVFSQDSRVNGGGFWVNDGGDVYVKLEQAKREKGDYHWFVRQSAVNSGSPTFTNEEVHDPYANIPAGSATTKYDVISNMGNNSVYTQQAVAEGWEENSVGYQIFIASFADSNGDGMGDLRGIINNLNYLEDLGVDTLWLTPFQSSNSYHGYDIMDYFSVDPRFGTLEDYRELIYKAHQKGMKVLLDFVLNHTSISNPWFVKSQNLVKETITLPDGRKKEIDYRNFYTWQNDDYVNGLTSERAKKQWYKDSNGYYFYSSFGSSMPELNFDYQATRDAILEVALYWMSFGLDGFRLDAVKHIYMANESRDYSDWVVADIDVANDADYSFDMNKDAHFFMEFNAKLKASYPNALLLGENFNGDPAKLAGLYGGMDSQFNFNWYYDTTWNLTKLANGEEAAATIVNQYLSAQFNFSQYRKDYIDGVFTSNHDVQRARDKLYNTDVGVPRTAKLGDSAWTLSENLSKLYAGLSLTVPGMTWIYNGDELGMFGTKTPNPVEDGNGHEDRWCRQPMKWTTEREDSEANCYYLMGFNNYYMEWDALNAQLHGVAEQKAEEDSILNFYKALIQIRKQNPVLSRGTVVSHTTGGSVVCYSVKDANSEVLIYVNATNKAQTASYDVPSGATLLYGSGVMSKTVPAMSMQVYKVKQGGATMKKVFALVLIVLLLCSSGAVFAAALSADNTAAPQAENTQGKIFLVPGTYVSNGEKVLNTVSNGATKLTQEQCDEIFTDNAYLCTLAQGDKLPTPTSERKDKDGKAFTFNGWWAIVDATVTYFDKVPQATDTMFLFADWRADLSQHKDPVVPDENTPITAMHYMKIKRAATGETETFVLRVSGTDMSNAEHLGYDGPVQLYNEWFLLNQGDVITVYTNGLDTDDMDTVKAAPIVVGSSERDITLEAAGDKSNITESYLSYSIPKSARQPATLKCIAEVSKHYRIYIKFYYDGSNMAVYMEPMD